MNYDIDTGIFDGLRDNEEIHFVWRRNPFTFMKAASVVIILTLSVVGSLMIFGASPVTSLLMAAWLVVVPTIIGVSWYIYRYDTYVLTNQRLIDIDQESVFHRAVAEAPLENIQDVTYEIRGPISTLLNMGTVVVQTASVNTQISIEGVTDPQAIQQAILRRAQERRSKSPRANKGHED